MTTKLSLATGLLAAPVVTLFSHEFMYLASMQSCKSGPSPAAHAVPAVGMLLVLAVTLLSWRNWNASRTANEAQPHHSSPSAVPAEHGYQDIRAGAVPSFHVHPRGHFLATVGVGIGVFCALVVAAQWLVLVMFGTCTRQ